MYFARTSRVSSARRSIEDRSIESLWSPSMADYKIGLSSQQESQTKIGIQEWKQEATQEQTRHNKETIVMKEQSTGFVP